jgi:hypothetical protein
VRALVAAGVDAVKLAIDAPSLDRLDGALRALAPEVRLVGVFWADRTPDLDCLPRLAGASPIPQPAYRQRALAFAVQRPNPLAIMLRMTAQT